MSVGTLKRLIARKGRPEKIQSDNDRTFMVAAKWLRNVIKDGHLHDFLAKSKVRRQFNLREVILSGCFGLVKRLPKRGGEWCSFSGASFKVYCSSWRLP